jgi:molecular chaperone GrpE
MSSKNKNSDRKRVKAEDLIAQAVRQVEEEEGKTIVEKSDDDQPQEKAPTQHTPSAATDIAQIDVQKYVEKEAYLRLAADLENFRKRAIRERQEAERNGRERILRGCLEIFDNLERGLKGAKDQNDPLAEGIKMILSQVENWLKSEGLQSIATKGEIFDPAVHEAVTQIERQDLPNGSIVEEVRKGYRWSDRLLRPASVVVSKQKEEAGA